MKIYYQKDVQKEALKNKTIATLGYGSQGHAHANNLKDSGYNVVVGLYPESKSRKAAEDAGLRVVDVADAAKEADIIMFLIPDQTQGAVYAKEVAPHLKAT